MNLLRTPDDIQPGVSRAETSGVHHANDMRLAAKKCNVSANALFSTPGAVRKAANLLKKSASSLAPVQSALLQMKGSNSSSSLAASRIASQAASRQESRRNTGSESAHGDRLSDLAEEGDSEESEDEYDFRAAAERVDELLREVNGDDRTEVLLELNDIYSSRQEEVRVRLMELETEEIGFEIREGEVKNSMDTMLRQLEDKQMREVKCLVEAKNTLRAGASGKLRKRTKFSRRGSCSSLISEQDDIADLEASPASAFADVSMSPSIKRPSIFETSMKKATALADASEIDPDTAKAKLKDYHDQVTQSLDKLNQLEVKPDVELTSQVYDDMDKLQSWHEAFDVAAEVARKKVDALKAALEQAKRGSQPPQSEDGSPARTGRRVSDGSPVASLPSVSDQAVLELIEDMREEVCGTRAQAAQLDAELLESEVLQLEDLLRSENFDMEELEKSKARRKKLDEAMTKAMRSVTGNGKWVVVTDEEDLKALGNSPGSPKVKWVEGGDDDEEVSSRAVDQTSVSHADVEDAFVCADSAQRRLLASKETLSGLQQQRSLITYCKNKAQQGIDGLLADYNPDRAALSLKAEDEWKSIQKSVELTKAESDCSGSHSECSGVELPEEHADPEAETDQEVDELRKQIQHIQQHILRDSRSIAQEKKKQRSSAKRMKALKQSHAIMLTKNKGLPRDLPAIEGALKDIQGEEATTRVKLLAGADDLEREVRMLEKARRDAETACAASALQQEQTDQEQHVHQEHERDLLKTSEHPDAEPEPRDSEREQLPLMQSSTQSSGAQSSEVQSSNPPSAGQQPLMQSSVQSSGASSVTAAEDFTDFGEEPAPPNREERRRSLLQLVQEHSEGKTQEQVDLEIQAVEKLTTETAFSSEEALAADADDQQELEEQLLVRALSEKLGIQTTGRRASVQEKEGLIEILQLNAKGEEVQHEIDEINVRMKQLRILTQGPSGGVVTLQSIQSVIGMGDDEKDTKPPAELLQLRKDVAFRQTAVLDLRRRWWFEHKELEAWALHHQLGATPQETHHHSAPEEAPAQSMLDLFSHIPSPGVAGADQVPSEDSTGDGAQVLGGSHSMKMRGLPSFHKAATTMQATASMEPPEHMQVFALDEDIRHSRGEERAKTSFAISPHTRFSVVRREVRSSTSGAVGARASIARASVSQRRTSAAKSMNALFSSAPEAAPSTEQATETPRRRNSLFGPD